MFVINKHWHLLVLWTHKLWMESLEKTMSNKTRLTLRAAGWPSSRRKSTVSQRFHSAPSKHITNHRSTTSRAFLCVCVCFQLEHILQIKHTNVSDVHLAAKFSLVQNPSSNISNTTILYLLLCPLKALGKLQVALKLSGKHLHPAVPPLWPSLWPVSWLVAWWHTHQEPRQLLEIKSTATSTVCLFGAKCGTPLRL